MSEGVIVAGDKVHIMTRRLFADDIRRHFVGEVTTVSQHIVAVEGYTFVFRQATNSFHRRPELRRRIFAFGDAGHIVNIVPRQVDIAALQYSVVEKRLTLSDGAGFSLDVNEFGYAG